MNSNYEDNIPLISIIVPVYNSGEHLTECINSLISQSYSKIEIILINDGSTDNSEDICKDFTLSDSRVKLISQPNEGVSSARNKGLEYTHGDYIAFVDSDDYVTTDFIQLLYDGIIGFDISICGLYRFNELTTPRAMLIDIPNELSHDSLYYYVLCNNNIGGYLCNKLFCSEIIRKHNIRLNTNITIGEDMLWLASYLKYVNKGFYISKCLYYYRINTTSALQSSYNSRIFNTKNISNLDASDLIHTITANESAFVCSAMSYRYVRTSMWLFFNMLTCLYYDNNVLTRIQNKVRSNLASYTKSKESKLLEKLVAIGLAINSKFTFKTASLLIKCLPTSFINKYLN